MFGGTFEFLDAAAELQMLLAQETLSKGYMGTDENLLSIILARFPQLVRCVASPRAEMRARHHAHAHVSACLPPLPQSPPLWPPPTP
jgi:hypothetical protein